MTLHLNLVKLFSIAAILATFPSSTFQLNSFLFKKVVVDESSFAVGLLKTAKGYLTPVECGGLCSLTPKCYFYYFDVSTSVCKLSSGQNIVPPKLTSLTVYADLTFPATVCTTTTYTRSNNVTACLNDLHFARNYGDAVSECVGRSMRMPEIWNAEEQADISSRMTSFGYIGGRDAGHESRWVWEDSQRTATYTNWNSGEPNGWIVENCAQMLTSGKWQDAVCDLFIFGFDTFKLPVVCERLLWI